ncbi:MULTISPECIES: hypothetical protein [unclassified Frankia]|uniref:hypothetical protein n=1 Tax=unclassified Frankia TaxID=2632575 RepID=UPI001931BFAA|nr:MULTISPECIES: hypothetical protein [unclassified Frankia]MBL7492352.1 hypothetical protein [Frankia sp. AgW1.1]
MHQVIYRWLPTGGETNLKYGYDFGPVATSLPVTNPDLGISSGLNAWVRRAGAWADPKSSGRHLSLCYLRPVDAPGMAAVAARWMRNDNHQSAIGHLLIGPVDVLTLDRALSLVNWRWWIDGSFSDPRVAKGWDRETVPLSRLAGVSLPPSTAEQFRWSTAEWTVALERLLGWLLLRGPDPARRVAIVPDVYALQSYALMRDLHAIAGDITAAGDIHDASAAPDSGGAGAPGASDADPASGERARDVYGDWSFAADLTGSAPFDTAPRFVFSTDYFAVVDSPSTGAVTRLDAAWFDTQSEDLKVLARRLVELYQGSKPEAAKQELANLVKQVGAALPDDDDVLPPAMTPKELPTPAGPKGSPKIPISSLVEYIAAVNPSVTGLVRNAANTDDLDDLIWAASRAMLNLAAPASHDDGSAGSTPSPTLLLSALETALPPWPVELRAPDERGELDNVRVRFERAFRECPRTASMRAAVWREFCLELSSRNNRAYKTAVELQKAVDLRATELAAPNDVSPAAVAALDDLKQQTAATHELLQNVHQQLADGENATQVLAGEVSTFRLQIVAKIDQTQDEARNLIRDVEGEFKSTYGDLAEKITTVRPEVQTSVARPGENERKQLRDGLRYGVAPAFQASCDAHLRELVERRLHDRVSPWDAYIAVIDTVRRSLFLTRADVGDLLAVTNTQLFGGALPELPRATGMEDHTAVLDQAVRSALTELARNRVTEAVSTFVLEKLINEFQARMRGLLGDILNGTRLILLGQHPTGRARTGADSSLVAFMVTSQLLNALYQVLESESMVSPAIERDIAVAERRLRQIFTAPGGQRALEWASETLGGLPNVAVFLISIGVVVGFVIGVVAFT